MNRTEMAEHFRNCVRFRVVVNGGSHNGGKTKFFETPEEAAEFVSKIGKLAPNETVDIFVCRSLALAVRPA